TEDAFCRSAAGDRVGALEFFQRVEVVLPLKQLAAVLEGLIVRGGCLRRRRADGDRDAERHTESAEACPERPGHIGRVEGILTPRGLITAAIRPAGDPSLR